MADFTDRVKLVFEAVTSDATKDLGKVTGATDEAGSGFAKLKGKAGDAISAIASSPVAIAGAGVAIAKVAFDLASGFQDAALSAQDFATASGLSVEQASRWQEVAGDLGVSTETLEGAVNKMNIAASKGALAELGIGGADTNEKLQNALAHLHGIDDATQRASEGAKIFGKSWASLAPLIEESGSLAANLASVSDAKVIDEGEVAKAREMRDAMDKLGDTIDDIKLTLGEGLIGPITDVAEILGNATDAANSLKDVTGGVGDVMRMLPGAGIPDLLDGIQRATDFSSGWKNQLGGVGEALTSNLPVIGGWASGLFGAADGADEAAAAADRQASATKVAAQAAQDAADANAEQEQSLAKLTSATLAAINSNLGLADAATKTDDAFAKYTTTAAAAEAQGGTSKKANDDMAEAMRGAESAALAQASAQLKLADDQATASGGALTASESNAILANSLRTTAGTLAADSPLRRDLLAYAEQVEKVPKTASTTFVADTESAAQQVAGLVSLIYKVAGQVFSFAIKPTPGSATQSSVPTVGSATITAPSSGGQARGLSAVAALPSPVAGTLVPAPSAGTVINLSVTVAPFTNPAEVGRSIADYLDAFYRRSGNRVRAVA